MPEVYKSATVRMFRKKLTNISLDAHKLNRAVITVITNKLSGISKKGRKLTKAEKERYGKSEMLRYLSDEPIYPVGYVQHKIPMNKKKKNVLLLLRNLRLQKKFIATIKIPKSQGGTDEYENLILVTKIVHKLIHTTTAVTVAKNLKFCNPDMKKLNELRKLVGNIIL